MEFKLVSDFTPSGDQPQAIEKLVKGLEEGIESQTLLGITGSGKTFTAANVIQQVNRPTLILSHNKTLAAQLYGEFKAFFPENSVEYFVSYYDYYQPEAFLPTTGTYIEKDLSINDEIEKLRLSASSALLSGRRDIIVVSSVSCIYGIGNPDEFHKNTISIERHMKVSRKALLHTFNTALYSRTEVDFQRGNFRVKGDTVDIFPAYADVYYRIHFWDDEIEKIESRNPENNNKIDTFEHLLIYPANLFVTSKELLFQAMDLIRYDLGKRVDFFREVGRGLEAKRLEERVNYDLEMIQELGYCSGIENYSRYLDGRDPGSRPFCLIDYFPDDYLMLIDESHVTIPQIRAMYGGDRSRKENLVEYGFRLPSAMDNRPLKFDEFESIQNQTIYISATPADYELEKSEGVFIEQIIRPTGLLDPVIEVRPSENQVDDLMAEIKLRAEKDERVLVTTLTKRMAEELTKYLTKYQIRCTYIHSDVETMERIEIMQNLRKGVIDVLIGVNLLREGLDLPEVSLVAILDADKEGFLRSERALVQTVGRAARNPDGIAILYADKITNSMEKTISATNRRRTIQKAYNKEYNLVPKALVKSIVSVFDETPESGKQYSTAFSNAEKVSEEDLIYMTKEQIHEKVKYFRKEMEKAADALDFPRAAFYRDEIQKLKTSKNG